MKTDETHTRISKRVRTKLNIICANTEETHNDLIERLADKELGRLSASGNTPKGTNAHS